MVVKTPVELGWYKILSNCGVVKLKIEKKFESSSRQHERYKQLNIFQASMLRNYTIFLASITISPQYVKNTSQIQPHQSAPS